MKEIDKELFNKIKQGKTVSELEACIFRGADIYATNDEGESIIHIAAKYGRQDFIMKLVQGYHVDVNHLDSEGRTPIYHAALCNRSGTVKTLVNKLRADFNIADRSGIAPIHAAILSEGITNKNLQDQSKINKLSLDILKFLVEIKEVDVNCITKNGWAPLHCAAKRGCFEIVEFLMKKGAIVGAKNSDGRNPLHIAATNGHVDIVGYLLNKEVDINNTDEENHTALYYAAWNGHRGVMDLLINKGAKNIDINGEDRMLLYRALDKDYLEVVKFIVEVNKVKVNSVDEEGRTLLFYLVDKGNPKVAELVINKGENVNPLSSLDCEVKIAKYLLSKGANVSVKDSHNRTLYAVAKKIYDEHSKSMLDCSATKSPPCDSQDITDKVFDLEADLGALTISGASGTSSNITGEDGHIESVSTLGDSRMQSFTYTSMCNAIKNSKSKKVKLFKCESTVINEVDENRNTLLHIAAKVGNVSIIKHLVEIGFSLDARNSDDDIPLCVAIKNSRSNAAAELAKGSDIRYENSKDKKQLLHLAVENSNPTIVRMLLSRGADCDAIDIDGNKPLDLNESGKNAGTIRDLFLTHNKQQSKVNDVEGQQVRSKFDSYLDNTPTSAGSSTQASASGFTNISEGAKITSSSSKPSSTFGGAMQKQNLGDSQQNVLKVEGLDKDGSVSESSQSSSLVRGGSVRSKVDTRHSSLRTRTYAAPRSRNASDFGEQCTFPERKRERRGIQEPRGSLQPPTYAAPRSRSAESDPKPEDEGKWVMRAGQGKKVNPRGRAK